jgi:hypothetical protein
VTTAAYIACVLYVLGFALKWIEHTLDPKLGRYPTSARMLLAFVWPIMAMSVIVIWIRVMWWPNKAADTDKRKESA